MKITKKVVLLACLAIAWGKIFSRDSSIVTQVDSLVSHFHYNEAKEKIASHLAGNPKLDYATQAQLWNKLSEIHFKFGDGEAAIEYGLKALAAAAKSNDKLLIAAAQINIIRGKQNIVDGADTPEAALGIMSLAVRNNQFDLLRSSHSVMGYHLLYSGDFKKANDHFSRALQISRKHLPATEVTNDMLMLSIAKISILQVDSSFILAQQAYDQAGQNGDTIMMAKSLLALSFLYMLIGNEEENNRLARESVALSRKMGMHLAAAQGLSQLMTGKIKKRDFQSAIKIGYEAADEAKSHPNLFMKAQIDSLLYTCFYELGDYKQAIFHFSRYNESMIKFFNRYQSFQLSQIEELQKVKEQEMTIEKQQLIIQNKQRKISAIVLANLLAVAVALGILAFYFIRRRNKRNLFLKEKMISGLMEESETSRAAYAASITAAAVQHPEEDNAEEEEGEEEEQVESPDIDLPQRKLLYDQLLFLLEKEKLYLDPDLDKNTLVNKLGTNKKYFYQATKYVGHTHLNHILNRYRVFEAKKIIESNCTPGAGELPQDLYIRAGFNSKSSYHRVFKEFTGFTPKEYANEFSNDLLTKKMKSESTPGC
ncbi:MAG: hypothetical protein RI973_1093 [Bacteroidota bacterium]|jgi:AraC-like DNA-binding protein